MVLHLWVLWPWVCYWDSLYFKFPSAKWKRSSECLTFLPVPVGSESATMAATEIGRKSEWSNLSPHQTSSSCALPRWKHQCLLRHLGLRLHPSADLATTLFSWLHHHPLPKWGPPPGPQEPPFCHFSKPPSTVSTSISQNTCNGNGTPSELP